MTTHPAFAATFIPGEIADLVPAMRAAHQDILSALDRHGIGYSDYPAFDQPGRPRGAGAARAYPMQGVLKYHGMTDWVWRIAYLPSVSINNDAAYSLTLVEFDPHLEQDTAVIGGAPADGRELERVKQTLDAVRREARIDSRARVVSKNVARAGRTGKGLGTSASGSAALAAAAVAAALGPQAAGHARFVSCMARLLAGSGCRSAAGGAALWLSYPGIAPQDSFAVRLDDGGQLDEVRLVTVPLDSRLGLKTEMVHADAPRSPFFRAWMANRRADVLRCIGAVRTGDWRTLGRLAEMDSIALHAVTMTGGEDHKIFAWEPENISLFRACDDLRAEGVPVYASTDTGPTAVLITDRQHVDRVAERIRSLRIAPDVVEGAIAGPVRLVSVEAARRELGLPGEG
jgi:diphosphomevalonate decarboxylase